MAEELCASCRRPRATQQCEACSDWCCRSCLQHLDSGTFSFRSDLPSELRHTRYCQACHQQHVEPALEEYEQWMEQAREAYIFFTTQKNPPPVVSKSKERLQVSECIDRDETILRLAFQAVRLGFNAVLETHVVAEKVRNAGYQKSAWRGTGVPAMVDADKLERRR